ncbi:MAG: hypothetical protein EZS28_029585, partial [Streblomastix strix]
MLQNPTSVPTLFTSHNIGLSAECQTDPLVALHVIHVPAITESLKGNVFPSADIINSLLVLASSTLKY